MGDNQDLGEKADELGRQADDSDTVDNAVRIGLVVYGLVYLVVAWLVVRLALGDHSESVSTEGALSEVGEQAFGRPLLFVVGGGMILLLCWRVMDALLGFRDKDGLELWRKRVAAIGQAIIYGALASKAISLALAGGSSGGGPGGGSKGGGTRGITAKLMDLPLGQFVVGAVGLGVICAGAVQIWKGLSNKYRENLGSEGKRGTAGSAYLLLGKVGYVAKGLVVASVGALFVYAAFTHEPDESSGVDGAVRQLLQQPFGAPLLVAVGVGISCYALFALVRARHLSR